MKKSCKIYVSLTNLLLIHRRKHFINLLRYLLRLLKHFGRQLRLQATLGLLVADQFLIERIGLAPARVRLGEVVRFVGAERYLLKGDGVSNFVST